MARPETTAAPSGPLAGLRVIELSGIGPAPFAAMLLADLGAEVVLVDRPEGSAGTVPDSEDVLRRNRRCICLNLRTPGGRRALLELVEHADVLIEGYRPGVAERLGVGPEDCWQHNPRLVYGRMTGWGQQGPLATTAGHDISYLAITGALHAIGRQGAPPTVPLNLVGDFAGGSLYLAFGLLAAVFETKRSQRGQVVDAAIVDGVSSLTAMMHSMFSAGLWRDERGSNLLDSGVPWYDVYETSDHQWMAAGPLEPKFYARFMSLLGLDPAEERRRDPAEWPRLREEIATAFAAKTRQDWTELFEGTDACVAPVLSLAEAPHHPHLAARKAFIDVDGVRQPAPAPRFGATPPPSPSPPTPSGKDTRQVLLDWGVTDIDELMGSGAAATIEDSVR
nr:CaiB/BaiF CoA-transferase family protein [Sciscionella marina]